MIWKEIAENKLLKQPLGTPASTDAPAPSNNISLIRLVSLNLASNFIRYFFLPAVKKDERCEEDIYAHLFHR